MQEQVIFQKEICLTHLIGCWNIVSVDKNDVDKTLASLKASGEEAYVIGELVNSDEGVIMC